MADKYMGCKFVFGSEQLILSSDPLRQLCNHCPYVGEHLENLKALGHTGLLVITLPEDMFSAHLVNIFLGTKKMENDIDLVKFFDACGFLMVSQKYVRHLINNTCFVNNKTVIPGLYVAYYKLRLVIVTRLILEQLGFSSLPKYFHLQPSYGKFRRYMRGLIRSNERFASLFHHYTSRYNAIIRKCNCQKCHDEKYRRLYGPNAPGEKVRQEIRALSGGSAEEDPHSGCPVCPALRSTDFPSVNQP